MNNSGKEKCLGSCNYQGIKNKQGNTRLNVSVNPNIQQSKLEAILKIVEAAHSEAVFSCEHFKLLGGLFGSIRSMSDQGGNIDVLAEIGMYFTDRLEGNHIYHDSKLEQSLAELNEVTL